MIEMIIDSIRVSLMNYQRVVILKEKTAERYLPIWIGPAEAEEVKQAYAKMGKSSAVAEERTATKPLPIFA